MAVDFASEFVPQEKADFASEFVPSDTRTDFASEFVPASESPQLAYPADLEPVLPNTEPPLGASLPDLLRRIPAGIAEGGAQAVAGLTKAFEDVTDIIPSVDSTVSPEEEMRQKQATEGSLTRAGDFMRQVASRARSDYGVDPKRNEAFLSQVASGAGSVVPTFASGPAAPLTMAAMMGESERANAEQMGATPEQQNTAFYANAAVGALSEALLGVPALLRSVKAAKIPEATFRAMAKAASFEAFKSSLREGTQEGLEQFAQNLIAKYISAYDPEREALEGVGSSFLVGATIGGPLGGVTKVASDISALRPVTVNLEAGTATTPDGRTVTVDEMGVTEVVPGSPKDISTQVLVPEQKGPIENAIQEQETNAQVLRPETTGTGEGVGLPGVGAENVVAPEAPAEAQPKVVLAPFTPQTEGEQIISTGILSEDGTPLTGDQWNAPHAEIIKQNPELALMDDVESRKGFIIQDADGNQRFVGRKQALEVGEKAGQVDVEKVYDPTGHGLISEALVPATPSTPQAEEVVTEIPPTPATPQETVEAPPGPPPPAEPIENRGRPEIPSPTGIRNERVDANRVAQGLPPRMAPLRKQFGTEWDNAMAIADQNPDAGTALVDGILQSPRALTPTENALLAHEQVTRENAYNEALRAVNSATNEVDRRTAESLLTRARDRNQQIYDAGQAAGTQSGQSLAFRKMLVNRDYSLASMEAEVRALKGGDPLTEAELKEVEVLHSKINAAEERAQKAEEKLSQIQGYEEYQKLLKLAKKETSSARSEGKSILDKIISNGEVAMKRIRERSKSGRSMMSATIIDPVDFVDYVQVGAGYIAKGIRTLGEFTKRLTSDFGDQLEPHSERIFNAAQGLHDQSFARSPKVETVQQAAAKDREGTLDPQVVYDVARAHVNAGVNGFEPTMQATTATLKALHPDITVRDVRDAFSGYGKVTRPSQEADRIKLREYRRLAQLTSAIEDANKKLAPLKSGAQRDKATEEVRAKMAELKRAMEENGIEVTSPEQQLANSERAATTRLQNTIESLERQIATKTRDAEGKKTSVDTPEIKALRERVDSLRKTLDEVAPKPADTEDQKVERAIIATKRSIEELDRQLKGGDKRTPSEPVSSIELDSLRSERDAMRTALKELQNASKTKKSPEEVALQRYKTSIQNRTKDIQDRIARNDYAKRPRKETALDAEALDARFQYQKAKDAFEQKAFEYDLSRRSGLRRAYDTALEVLNTSRAIITSFDVSAPLRQGAFITLAHPIRSAKNLPSMFRAFASEKAAFDLQESLSDPTRRPNAAQYRQSGLDLTEVGGNVSRRKLEEAYQSRFASRIPIVAGSQRAYTTFLNQLRADSYDAMVKSLGVDGKVTPEEGKAIANFINTATGRAKYGETLERSTELLNAVFFAPKYVASRFKLIADPLTGFSLSSGAPMSKSSLPRVRKQVAKEYARFLAGAGLVLGLSKLAGAGVEDDPRSSDFGKIKIGNTRLDLMGGLSQVSVLLSRLGSSQTKDLKTGRIKEADRGQLVKQFLLSKISPAFSFAGEITRGKDIMDRPVTTAGALSGLVVPMSFGDIMDAMVEQGIPRGSALSLLSLFGASMSTFEAGRREREAREPWEELQRDVRAIQQNPMEGRRGLRSQN